MTTATLQHWPARLKCRLRARARVRPSHGTRPRWPRRRPHPEAEPGRWAPGGSWKRRWRRERAKPGRSGPRRAPPGAASPPAAREAEKLSWACASRGVCCRIGNAVGAAMVRKMLSSLCALVPGARLTTSYQTVLSLKQPEHGKARCPEVTHGNGHGRALFDSASGAWAGADRPCRFESKANRSGRRSIAGKRAGTAARRRTGHRDQSRRVKQPFPGKPLSPPRVQRFTWVFPTMKSGSNSPSTARAHRSQRIPLKRTTPRLSTLESTSPVSPSRWLLWAGLLPIASSC